MKREIDKVTAYLAEHGYEIKEGSSSIEELEYLQNLVHRENVRIIGEIGFNAGFSSYAFLQTHPDITVVSFDIGKHPYVRPAKEFIDKNFPNRHTLIFGDSKETLPEFFKERPDFRFDLVFIDGSHDYETAKSDIINVRLLSTPKTAVVIDDLTPWLWWGKGPTKAWLEAIEKGVIKQEELLKDGKHTDKIEPPGERSWALGKYVL